MVLTSTSLRHPHLYNDGADTAHAAQVQWLLGRSWRSELPTLRTEEQVSTAMAEADVFPGLVQAAGGGNEAYTPGLLIGQEKVRPRLLARLRDPRQWTVLALL